MADEKEQKSQKTRDSARQVFEIHTMAKDNEIKIAAPQATILKEQASVKKNEKLPKKQPKKATANPFLSEKKSDTVSESLKKKGSFSPKAQKEPVEKINQTPADIAPKKPKEQKPKNPKNIVRIMMIVCIILFISGAIGVFFWKFILNQEDVMLEMIDETPIEGVITESRVDLEESQYTYSTDLPNYFVLDVESEASEADIQTELTKIANNISVDDMAEPVAFTVNDVNSNPVSFHIFAMSAGMNIPQDILSSLEEEFEIYAYNDPEHGVRFGFVIDAKNVNLLQDALKAQEVQLPQAFDVILGSSITDPTGIVFQDNTYNTTPIRYTNLNEAESYSVDYTVSNFRLLLGSSKHTLRAIIEDLRGGTYVPEDDMVDDKPMIMGESDDMDDNAAVVDENINELVED